LGILHRIFEQIPAADVSVNTHLVEDERQLNRRDVRAEPAQDSHVARGG
jgi:hypothetical protein